MLVWNIFRTLDINHNFNVVFRVWDKIDNEHKYVQIKEKTQKITKKMEIRFVRLGQYIIDIFNVVLRVREKYIMNKNTYIKFR